MRGIVVGILMLVLMQLNAQSHIAHIDSVENKVYLHSPYLLLNPEWELQKSFFTEKQSSPFISDYKTEHLPGFFCKMEYKIEQKSRLSPRFRLGSLNYTEWMEGKGEFYNRYRP